MAKGYKKKKKASKAGSGGRPAILDIVDAAWGTTDASAWSADVGEAQYGASGLGSLTQTGNPSSTRKSQAGGGKGGGGRRP